MELKKNQYVLYKGLPLVREGDMLCYGDVDEKYILTLNILGKDDKEKPNMIMVQICHSNDRNKIVKGMYCNRNPKSSCFYSDISQYKTN